MSSEATYFPHPLAQATDVSDTVQLASVDRKCVEQTSVAKNLKTPLHMPESPDELLIEEVRNGSKDALAQLFRTYARTVRNVAYRILRDESEADDLVQEVFIYLFEKAALFDPSKGSASSWIMQVAYHRALNRRQYLNVRQHYNAGALDEERIVTGERPLFVDAVLAKTLLDRLRNEVSFEQRQTLELHFFEGYTFKEIAEKTGQTLGNVRNHYYRGVERLRACIFPQKGV